ncbi:hypothetical protein F5878DRAFT_127175 [Lentinula raphanica]|uniref:Uncharacterized protein n=1 Tax=Lentinula raphanica TaxID=153919 RepID=A0AA38PMU3_9AGAR|nr:hypothetical protein C8R42DRAFT_453223 [Lentinula raphanica]KAJ3845485.1 hypothetical protein F5878DRAFT_127175 [Lentinula raphanica]
MGADTIKLPYLPILVVVALLTFLRRKQSTSLTACAQLVPNLLAIHLIVTLATALFIMVQRARKQSRNAPLSSVNTATIGSKVPVLDDPSFTIRLSPSARLSMFSRSECFHFAHLSLNSRFPFIDVILTP